MGDKVYYRAMLIEFCGQGGRGWVDMSFLMSLGFAF